MDVVSYILKRARFGCTINVVRDGNGHCWADVGSRLPWGRTTSIELTREQYGIVRYAMIREGRWRPWKPAAASARHLAEAA